MSHLQGKDWDPLKGDFGKGVAQRAAPSSINTVLPPSSKFFHCQHRKTRPTCQKAKNPFLHCCETAKAGAVTGSATPTQACVNSGSSDILGKRKRSSKADYVSILSLLSLPVAQPAHDCSLRSRLASRSSSHCQRIHLRFAAKLKKFEYMEMYI